MSYPVPASLENMQAAYVAGIPVFAYSPETGEEYSANPHDYWQAGPGWVMEDSEGNFMRLVTRHTIVRNLTL